jgi:hypothetical protein
MMISKKSQSQGPRSEEKLLIQDRERGTHQIRANNQGRSLTIGHPGEEGLFRRVVSLRMIRTQTTGVRLAKRIYALAAATDHARNVSYTVK